MIKCFKPAMLSAILVAAAPVAAYAADPTPPQTQTRPQLATYPGSAYSSTQMPGPKGGGSTWIPSSQSQSAGFGRTEEGRFYTKKGFGPQTRPSASSDSNLFTPHWPVRPSQLTEIHATSLGAVLRTQSVA